MFNRKFIFYLCFFCWVAFSFRTFVYYCFDRRLLLNHNVHHKSFGWTLCGFVVSFNSMANLKCVNTTVILKTKTQTWQYKLLAIKNKQVMNSLGFLEVYMSRVSSHPSAVFVYNKWLFGKVSNVQWTVQQMEIMAFVAQLLSIATNETYTRKIHANMRLDA